MSQNAHRKIGEILKSVGLCSDKAWRKFMDENTARLRQSFGMDTQSAPPVDYAEMELRVAAEACKSESPAPNCEAQEIDKDN